MAGSIARKKRTDVKTGRSVAPKKGKSIILSKRGKTQRTVEYDSSKTSQLKNFFEEKRSLFHIRIKRKYIIIPFLLLLLAFFVYQLRGLFVAAVVNGEPIFRVTVVQELEKRAGKQILTSLVTRILIAQEAKKKKVKVSDSEIDSEIKRIEESIKKQGQKLEDALALQGMSKQDLVEQIRMQKTAEKIFASEVKVTDEELNKYLEENKQLFPEGVTDEAKKDVKESLKQKKLSEKFQSWLQQAQGKSTINYFVQYK